MKCSSTLVALALASGCALVAPLDPLSASAKPACRDVGCMDASSRPDATMPDAAPSAPAADGGSDAQPARDAAIASCDVQPGVECNPVAQCGCASDHACGLDPDSKSVGCLPKGTGNSADGERCADSSDCAVGLECTQDRICSQYCATDAECHGAGKCVLAINPLKGSVVPGSGACSRWCDPLTGEPCRPGSGCYAAGATDTDPTATCRYFRDATTKPRGDNCEYYNQCDALLSCAQFGPSVCTKWCQRDADCPSDTPHCYLSVNQRLVAAPNEPIGQCTVWPCDDAHVLSPKPWSEGPVWTSAQNLTCANRCGPSRDCYRTNCADGDRWGQCFDQTLQACAGATGAACRNQYVTLACSDVDGRTPIENDFTNCAVAQPDCVKMAEAACSEMP